MLWTIYTFSEGPVYDFAPAGLGFPALASYSASLMHSSHSQAWWWSQVTWVSRLIIKGLVIHLERTCNTSLVSPLRLLLLEPCVLLHRSCQLCLSLAVRKHNIDFEVGMEDLEQELSLYNYIDQAPVRALHRSFLIGVSPLPPPPCGSCRGQRLLELLGAWNLEKE